MWGTCGGLFGANYVLYFEITWLPFYLLRERHLSMGTIGKIGGLGYLCYAAAAVVFGWISNRWIAAGGTPTLVRRLLRERALPGYSSLAAPAPVPRSLLFCCY